MLFTKVLGRWDKHAKIELAFFIIYFMLTPLISDIEYSINEAPQELTTSNYKIVILRRLIWGMFKILPSYLFYKICIRGLLINKKYWQFICSCIGYAFVFHLYTKYVMYLSLANMPFLPDEMIVEAKRWFKIKNRLTISINYLIRELLILVALAYYIRHEKQREQIQQLKELELKTNLKYLKAQLEPHFFFNTMNNIYALALKQSEHTAPMIAKLSDLMRYILNTLPNQKVSLSQEINFIENYIQLEGIRYNTRNSINFEAQGIKEQHLIEPLLLLPYIENAFKHGLEDETAKGSINIVIHLADNELTLSIQNSKAVKKESIQKNGIGMINAKKRLSLLYPDQHTIVIEETSDTYFIVLTIQL